MRQPAGQRPDCFGLDLLSALLLALNPLGNIHRETRDMLKASVLGLNRKREVPDPDDGPVRADDTILFLRPQTLEGTVTKGNDEWSIVRVNCLKKGTWIPQQGLAATPPDHVVSRADVDRAPGNGICDPEYFADILDYTRKLLFALSQVILVLLTGNELP